MSSAQLLRRNAARAQQARTLTRQVDDRGFHADLAGAAVQNGLDAAVHVMQHVGRRRGRGLAGAVGRRRGDRHTRQPDELTRRGRFRAADGDGIQPCRRALRHEIADGQHHCQRAGPEVLRQQPRLRGDVMADRLQLLRLGDMQNEGVVLRTPLRLEDAQHGVLVEPVCPEAVDGLGRDGDELAASQQPGCGGNVLRTLRREHLCFHDLSLLSLRRSFSA